MRAVVGDLAGSLNLSLVADTKWSSSDANQASTRPPSRHAWTAMSTVEPDRPSMDDSESSSSEPPPSSRIKTKAMPRTLDEAEPVRLSNFKCQTLNRSFTHVEMARRSTHCLIVYVAHVRCLCPHAYSEFRSD